MVLIQDASFKKPRGKNWRQKYVQLDFNVSVKELYDILQNLDKESLGMEYDKFLDQKWSLQAFMEKCDCPDCAVGWKAHEKALEESYGKS